MKLILCTYQLLFSVPVMLLLLSSLFSAKDVYGQTAIKKYVSENAVPIATVDPDSTNFSDLKAIGTAIGNARVVMLGEQDHGDAPAFLAKTRLSELPPSEKAA